MTILVAVKKHGRIFLGADRITTSGSYYATDLVDGSKIMKLKHGYLATSGYSLIDNVIEHLHKSNHKLMDNTFKDRSEVFSFFLELYNEMKKSYTLVDPGKDTYGSFYNAFLAVTPDAIYGVSSNLSVHKYENFAVKGAGSDYALGCLYGTYDLFSDGFEIVRCALEAACHYSIYCKEPIDIMEVQEQDFANTSNSVYKVKGRKLTTLSKRKGVAHLVAIERSKIKSETNGRGVSGKGALNKANGGRATASKSAAGAKKRQKKKR